ncbi:MAG: tetratricopeptide repeat protein, partial [Sphingomicrobium sp.]
MSGAGDDPEALAILARDALTNGDEETAAPLLDAAARRIGNDARLWQWTGLLYRALDEHQVALDAFAAAAKAAPGDALIAHGRARVALEAGLDARSLFDTALLLGPSGEVLLGRAAARFAMGEDEAAIEEMAQLLDRNPGWSQGHVQWAQLAAKAGRADEATTTIDRALGAQPRDAALWLAAIDIETKAERHAAVWRRADAAIVATGDEARFALPRASALSDAGETERATAAFDALGEPQQAGHALLLARHFIRVGNPTGLAQLADRWMNGDSAHLFWPYASIAWRQSADPRWQWLEGDERLISITDLSPRLPPLDQLAVCLRTLHASSGRYLDQSVRG